MGNRRGAVAAVRRVAGNRAGRVRGNRHRRCGRSDVSVHPGLPPTTSISTNASSCARRRPRSSSAFHSRTGVASAIATCTPLAPLAVRPGWVDFQHFWLAAQELGFGGELGDYCFERQAAMAGKFALSETVKINYAYHFDAGSVRRSPASHERSQRASSASKARSHSVRAASGERLHQVAGARVGRVRAGRSVCRLHGVPRVADRADSQGGVRGLQPLVAYRQRAGGADSFHRRDPALHALHRAPGRMAMEDSPAASRRQRPGILQPVP